MEGLIISEELGGGRVNNLWGTWGKGLIISEELGGGRVNWGTW